MTLETITIFQVSILSRRSFIINLKACTEIAGEWRKGETKMLTFRTLILLLIFMGTEEIEVNQRLEGTIITFQIISSDNVGATTSTEIRTDVNTNY